MRIGHGYDVHRFCEGEYVVIGGVKIPYEKKLLAHSDGDVLAHAIADSLLGAAGQRDIGFFFPDNDQKYKNIDSMILLSKVKEIIMNAGYDIENLDSTIIAQAPKMRPHIDTMRENIAKALRIDVSQVNVKATTEEFFRYLDKGQWNAAAELMEGKIVLLCDTSPQAMILPTSFFDFLEETDDYYFPPLTGTYLRLLRILVFLAAPLIPALWVLALGMGEALPPPSPFSFPKRWAPSPFCCRSIWRRSPSMP